MSCHGVAVVVEVFRDLARIPRSIRGGVYRRAGNQFRTHLGFTVEMQYSHYQTIRHRKYHYGFTQTAKGLYLHTEAIWTKLLKRFVRRTGLGKISGVLLEG